MYVQVWSRVPSAIKPKMQYYNIPISAKSDGDNPLDYIRELCKPEDYVMLKLDIDTNPVERDIIAQVLLGPGRRRCSSAPAVATGIPPSLCRAFRCIADQLLTSCSVLKAVHQWQVNERANRQRSAAERVVWRPLNVSKDSNTGIFGNICLRKHGKEIVGLPIVIHEARLA